MQLLVVSAAMPDLNMDGTVNIFDINLVSANWGPVPGSATAVPEPATWAMLLSAAVIGVPVLMRKRRV